MEVVFSFIEKSFENLGEVEAQNHRWFGVGGLTAGFFGGLLAIPAMLLVPEAEALSLSIYGAGVSIFGFIASLILLPYHLSGWEVVRSGLCGTVGLFIGICLPIFGLATLRFLSS